MTTGRPSITTPVPERVLTLVSAINLAGALTGEVASTLRKVCRFTASCGSSGSPRFLMRNPPMSRLQVAGGREHRLMLDILESTYSLLAPSFALMGVRTLVKNCSLMLREDAGAVN